MPLSRLRSPLRIKWRIRAFILAATSDFMRSHRWEGLEGAEFRKPMAGIHPIV